jgi:hypothetical protein
VLFAEDRFTKNFANKNNLLSGPGGLHAVNFCPEMEAFLSICTCNALTVRLASSEFVRLSCMALSEVYRTGKYLVFGKHNPVILHKNFIFSSTLSSFV